MSAGDSWGPTAPAQFLGDPVLLISMLTNAILKLLSNDSVNYIQEEGCRILDDTFCEKNM